MAFMIQKNLLLCIIIFIALSYNISHIHCQQNIETHYPSSPSPASLIPPPPVYNPPPPVYSPPLTPLLLPPPPTPAKTSNNNTLGTAVAATAASTFVISGLVFFLIVKRRSMAQRKKNQGMAIAGGGSPPPPMMVSREDFSRFDGNVKGIIVDENGLDVLYWRKLQSQKQRSSFKRDFPKKSKEDEEESEQGGFINRRTQEVPLLRGESSTSELKIHPAEEFNPPSLQPPTDPSPPPKPPQAVKFAATPASKIERGSLKVDDGLMEAMFGYVATNRKTPQPNKPPPNAGNLSPGPAGQIFILERRKSQNIAIVLKSLAVSRKEILDALSDGQGLNVEILEKLNIISPSTEEETEILNFDGDPTKLADAESFLFHILRAVPSAFTRFNAMLFKLNYEAEIVNLKESIETVDRGCQELRTRGLFMKLLEAVVKAGNRMNAGTSRGNAQAFNLNALNKLADVKSSDSKTTLLHFVVEEVVRSEGRKCVLNRSRSLSRTNSDKAENKEKEFIMLGLPVVGGLSQEFSNVKKAATIDYDSFSSHCSVLGSRVSEIREIVSRGGDNGGGFVREMLGFLEKVETEITNIRRQQNSAVELVKSTIEYYQGGASKEKGSNPLQLFVNIRDFLNMVDRVCVEIARNVQKKKMTVVGPGSSTRKTMRFPKLPPNFMSEKSNDSDTDS